MQKLGSSICVPCILALILLSTSCHTPTEEAVLRYTPQVGNTYRYRLTIHPSHNPIEVTGEMHVLSEQEEEYQIQFSGMLADEVFSRAMIISDRHNTSDPGYVSMNFPDEPVMPGAEWSGDVPWYFENYYVLDPADISLPASYKLVEVKEGESGRCAVIEQRTEADVAVDGLVLYVGQVGVRWDHAGRITEVYPGYDAFGKLQVGDVIVGINGKKAEAAGSLTWLAEKYIQRPKEVRIVSFAIVRDGKEQEVNVKKSIDKLAVVKVYNMNGILKTTFDVDRGILLSAEATTSHEDVAFTSPTTDTFPVVDDYDGFHKFGYLRGRTTYQDRLGRDQVAWILSLIEQ